MRVVTAASIVVGAIWIAAAPLVMVAVYGAGFLPGASALQWLAGACIVAAFSGHYRYSLIASGHQGKEMFAMAAGSIMAVLLIPIGYFNAGTSGAGAALFAAECVVLACSWLLAKRYLVGRARVAISTSESLTSLPGVAQ
jgi:O-antigen/teichoic acid export membrane protein